jgi:hypothetical protein
MPLATFTSAEASKNLRRRGSLWPDGRSKTDRLGQYATVGLNPSFTFDRGDRIYTIGSCFAREIEQRLSELGMDLPVLKVALALEVDKAGKDIDILNKYTIGSMVNEVRWAFEGCAVAPERLFIELGDGLWHDAHLAPNLKPASLQRVIERRAIVLNAVRELPSCRIVIVTLGLAESWFDAESGLYLNVAPPQAAMSKHPDRFSLHVLDYADILSGLEDLRALVRKHGHPEARMLLTVSPVPFKATFTGEDALAANCYSKSVQRAACEAFVRAHEDIDYFPSYEAVTLSDRSMAFEEDNIHVRRELVGQIMRDVIKAYAPSLDIGEDKALPTAPPRKRMPQPNTLLMRANEQSAQGDYLEAVVTMGSLFHRYGDTASPGDLASWRSRYANLCIYAGDKEGAKRHALLVGGDCGDAAALYLSGITLSRLGLEDEARVRLHQATVLGPQHAEYAWRYGHAMLGSGDRDAAKEYFERALAIDPEHKHALNSLSKLMRRRA